MLRISIIVFGFLIPSLSNSQVKPGFILEKIAERIDPSAIVVDQSDRIFVAEKPGRVWIVENELIADQPFLEVEVDNFSERGLSGIALDPEFLENGFIYVYYTVPGGNHNRVSRFSSNGSHADPASEQVLLDLDPLKGPYHNGGAMFFGVDGKLYISTGDGTDFSVSQSFESLLGKVLRINADGSIPDDNPFYTSTTGSKRAIYALGLRNPFSMSMDARSGRIFANDVGEASYEEVNEILPGGNYGWPLIEGYREPHHSPPANYVDPFYAYHHSEGCAVVGSAFYTMASASFPEEFQNSYLFGDYCSMYVKALNLETKEVHTLLNNFNRPIAFTVTSSGELYLFARNGLNGGSHEANTATEDGELWKLVYTGSEMPVIYKYPKNFLFSVGDDVELEIKASGIEPLTYVWSINGEEVENSSGNIFRFSNIQLNHDGAEIHCTVSNEVGEVRKVVGVLEVTTNRRPEITIHSLNPDLYSAGETLVFKADVFDQEDGPISPLSIKWIVDFHHDDHTHPVIAPTSGLDSVSFEVSRNNEVSPNVWFRVHASTTDSDNFLGQTFFDIEPRLASISLQTDLPGAKAELNGQPIVLPYEFVGVTGVERHLKVFNLQEDQGNLYRIRHQPEESLDGSYSFHTPVGDSTINLFYDPVSIQGSGIKAEYFSSSQGLRGTPTLIRVEPSIDLTWEDKPPLGDHNFAVRWSGILEVPYSGYYQFHLDASKDATLWIGDVQQPREAPPHLMMRDTPYPVKVEYENIDFLPSGFVRLRWSASELPLSTIPANYFSVSHIEVSNKFAVFPNPVTDFIHVVADKDFNLRRIELLDATGKRVFTADVRSEETSAGEFWLPVKGIPEGIFSLILTNDEVKHFFYRIIVQRN